MNKRPATLGSRWTAAWLKADVEAARLAAGRSGAFTLIELLVVVTIIVVLLALLVPAMDKAIYQAELTECGARLKVAASTVTQYAFENRRNYPERGLRNLDSSDRTKVAWITPMALNRTTSSYDIRPLLSQYMQVNKVAQCPLSEQLDLMDTPTGVDVDASYAMFWGWRYDRPDRTRVQPMQQQKVSQQAGASGQAMYRYGDKFTWEGAAYRILAGDIDVRFPENSNSNHPDNEGKMGLVTLLDEPGVSGLIRASRWIYQSDRMRGDIDVNFVFDDGAVQRYLKVPHMIRDYDDRDPRFDWAPVQFASNSPDDKLQLPLR